MPATPFPLSPETAALLQEHDRRTALAARIGNTPFSEHPELAELFQIKHLWIKDESTNLTGTIKDRKSLALLSSTSLVSTQPPGCGYITITNGNMGYSLGTVVDDKSRVISIIDKNTNEYIKEKLAQVSIVLEYDLRSQRLTPEEFKEITKLHSSSEKQRWIIDSETHLHEMYNTLLNELAANFRQNNLNTKNVPVIVPLGGGELMASVVSQRYHTIGATERHNFPAKISRKLYYDTVHWPIEKKEYLADKLVTSYISATTKRTITHAQKHGRAKIVSIPSEDILRAYTLLHQHNIRAEPSAATAFASLWQLKDKPEHVIVINTGEGVYDKEKLRF